MAYPAGAVTHCSAKGPTPIGEGNLSPIGLSGEAMQPSARISTYPCDGTPAAWHLFGLGFGLFWLLWLAPDARATAGWHPAIRLDSADAAFPTVSWAPNGDLRVFYTLLGTPDRMVARLRPRDAADFGPESFVVNGGRAVAVRYGTGEVMDAAVATSASVLLMQSTNNGGTWLYQTSYSGRASADLPGYLPMAFTEAGGDLRLVYGYQTRTLFGLLPEVYHARRSGGTWEESGTRVNTGLVRGAWEGGDTICIVASQGVLLSTNQGSSFRVRGRTGPAADQLQASSMAIGHDHRIYLLRTYTYGPIGADQQLVLTFSDDGGVTWASPQWTVVSNAVAAFVAPQLAVAGDWILAVWQHAEPPNGSQHIRGILSNDAGRTWGPIETIASLTGNETFDAEGALHLAGQGDRMALTYAVRDGPSPAGVFLQEWIAPDQERPLLRVGLGPLGPDAPSVVVSWDTQVGKGYQLYAHTNLATAWPPSFVHEVQGNGSVVSFTDSEGLDQRFFRLRVTP